MTEPKHAERPSSWPIRRERQSIAAAHNMQQILARLDQIDTKLASCRCHNFTRPPGLDERNYYADLDDRVRRLETLYVCSNNTEVDEVIHQMLRRKAVQSPCFSSNTTCDTAESTENEKEAGNQTTDFFDITDLMHKAVQTDVVHCCPTPSVDEVRAETLQHLVGVWTPIDKLKKGDVIKVSSPFVDATVGLQVQLAEDTLGSVIGIDTDGDAEVHFPSLTQLRERERYRWILRSSFCHLVKNVQTDTTIDNKILG